jgi:hypothetical protein
MLKFLILFLHIFSYLLQKMLAVLLRAKKVGHQRHCLDFQCETTLI